MKFRTRTTIVIETEEEVEVNNERHILREREISEETSRDLIQKAEKVGKKFVKWYTNGDEQVTTLIDCDVTVGVTEE